MTAVTSEGFRRKADALTPFFVGLALGVLTTFATFSGRVSALETSVQVHTNEINDIRASLTGLGDKMDRLLDRNLEKP